LTLSDDPANQIPFEKPVGYRELDHELLLRNFEAGDERLPGRLAKLPQRKIDWNTFGAVGTDMAGASFGYADADYDTRLRLDRLHELYTRGHLWTLANHPRVPDSIRKEMRRWGFAKDEFQRSGGFPYMIYVREGRRMLSDLVMTEHYGRLQKTAADPVALASFAMDSHVVQYVVNERGFTERERRVVEVFQEASGWLLRSPPPMPADLPPRLRDTLAALAAGLSEKQVAARLGISAHTVHEYTKALYRRFGVQSRAELLARHLGKG